MVHIHISNRLFILVVLCLIAFRGFSQETLQVFTKKIERQFEGDETNLINIEGFKSTVNIDTWNKNEVKVVLKLISKSPDQDVAERELAYQRHVVEKRKGTIYLKNYLALPSGVTKLNSIQISSYDITVPEGIKIEIKNEYGDVYMKQLNGYLKIDAKYGNVQLDNVNATVDINTYFGDLRLHNVDGIINLNANHTNVDLHEIGGQIKIQLILGDLFIGQMDDNTDLSVVASKADITIEKPDYQVFNFEMDTSYGDILVPDELRKYFNTDTQKRKSFIYESSVNGRPIKLKTTFGNIVAK